MSVLKVLYVVHNHPGNRPGGTEAYALELYRAMQSSQEVEPLFLAKTGPPVSKTSCYHPGTLLTRVGDGAQFLFNTDGSNYDWLNGRLPNKLPLTKFLREFLEAERPDVVHFQHTLFFGWDVLRATRNALPDAPIVYTLHEYIPICHRDGQMLRTAEANNELCRQESPIRCHECFPHVSPQDFFLRKRFIQAHLEYVDLFLAPSRFLLGRYVDWGLPAEKIRHEEHGFAEPAQIAGARETSSMAPRTRLAFFGQLSHPKGINVLLEAMTHLKKLAPDASLWIYGANLELQTEEFQSEFRRLLRKAKDNVVFCGPFHHDDLPKLIEDIDWVVIPSVWWENSPLVIHEAFMQRRPVICSDIGGMAEKVSHEVNGLQFRAGDPVKLAAALARAVSTPGLWEKLREGISAPHSMDEHVASLTSIYRNLLGSVPRREETRALESLG